MTQLNASPPTTPSTVTVPIPEDSTADGRVTLGVPGEVTAELDLAGGDDQRLLLQLSGPLTQVRASLAAIASAVRHLDTQLEQVEDYSSYGVWAVPHE